MDTKTFALNDRVRWTSQANGRLREKIGNIFKILQPGETPLTFGIPSAGKGWGSGRGTVSYVVEVQRARSKKYFWPLATKLQLVEAPTAAASE